MEGSAGCGANQLNPTAATDDLPLLYTDEDSGNAAYLKALERDGYDVITANDAATAGSDDEVHLRFAVGLERAVISQNVGDFHALHIRWMADGLEHWGIILVHQRHRYGPGEVARRMASLVRALGRRAYGTRSYSSATTPAATRHPS